ncbi:HAMP domain-containing protein [Marinomonas hwangdonensis]|uniref:histidine kinase n=1 Tax=Marinomonas hwangdonensis TaxID=1053647 RepID=A0A3M8PYY1_9GAMM|nr:ATP-binding protein [Marinomonas hwangdonensis]RNF49065.1 HAMP domain-containing protein [Marinomonas hwangdonensis]
MKLKHWIPKSVSTRLMLAFATVALMTLLAAGFASHSNGLLQQRLEQIRADSIEVLYASARLNELSQQLTAQVPRLISADSNYVRQRTREQLDRVLAEMQTWVIHLPDYNRYFIEIRDQIRYSIGLIYETVEERQGYAKSSDQQRLRLYPLYIEVNQVLDQRPLSEYSEALFATRLKLSYLFALAEKVHTDSTFKELDYTFLRLETLVDEIQRLELNDERLKEDFEKAPIDSLFLLVSREGPLFKEKNRELDLRYQEEFLVSNSQRHIQQLAVQISQYTERVNQRVDNEIAEAGLSVSKARDATFMLSIISLLLAASVSWFYVRRNILGRLVRLQSNMHAIASGALDINVIQEGRDEISEMARDLKIFQQAAIETTQMHRQLAVETEERLATEKRLRLAQQDLIQAGKLAALGQLSVAITHEINQPLAVMRNQLHSVGLCLEKELTEQAKSGIERLTLQLEKTANITHHLRGFARKTDQKPYAILLSPVIEAAVELLKSKSNHCHPELIGSDDILVIAEPIRLEQVMVNLIMNALDAVQQVSDPFVRIAWRVCPSAQWVEILVEDNGPGIEPDCKEHIFDPYFTTKSPSKGLGLGLSISYNILQDFEGSIALKETNQGACFQIMIPTKPNTARV